MEQIVIGIVDDDLDYIELFIDNVNKTFSESEIVVEIMPCVLDEDIDNRVQEAIDSMFYMDIIVMDFSMPKYSGIEIMRMFAEEHMARYEGETVVSPVPLFIMNTIHKDNVKICRQAMKAGFSDFVTNPKTDPSLLMDLLVEYVQARLNTKKMMSQLSEMIESGVLL